MERTQTKPLADLWRDSLARLERNNPSGTDTATNARRLAVAALIARARAVQPAEVEDEADRPAVRGMSAGRTRVCLST